MKRRSERLSALSKRAKIGQNGSEPISPADKAPEDTLYSIFEYITSLPDRFRVAAVNSKFRKCMLDLLKKPTALHFDVTDRHSNRWLLNGHPIPTSNWPRAISVLGSKTQFTEVVFSGEAELFKEVFEALVFPSIRALKTLLKFESTAGYSQMWYPASIRTVLRNTPNLSVLKLNLLCYELRNLHLLKTLTDRALTVVELRINCSTQELVLFFQNLRPNTLKRVTLHVMLFHESTLSLAEVLGTLTADAWSRLESLAFTRVCRGLEPVTTVENEFLQALGMLPLLQNCSRVLNCRRENQELRHNIVSYLTSSHSSPHERIFQCKHVKRGAYPFFRPHQAISLMRFVRAAVPDADVTLQIDWQAAGPPAAQALSVLIRFTSGNAIFELVEMVLRDEGYGYCADCMGFYPVLLRNLQIRANQRMGGHLEGFTLNRCKVKRLGGDLNKRTVTPMVLSVLPNRDQSEVEVNFQDELGQFTVTVDTAHCFKETCVGCVVV